MRTTVALDERTRDELLALRRKWGLRSTQQVIERLLEGVPATAVALYGARKRQVDAVLRRYGVEKVIAFGSRARGDARPSSDLDVAVALPPRADLLDLANLQEDLQEAFGLTTHVVSLDGVKGALRRTLDREGVTLVER